MKDCSVKDIAGILKNANSFVVTAHINSDGDALGSVLSLGAALETMGKRVHILIDDEIGSQYDFLPGIEKIRRPDEHDIIAADFLIILDASDFERIGRVAELVDVNYILNIDHHVSNIGMCDFRLLVVKAAATCEIIFDIIRELNIEIDSNMAINLYAGIASDCGFFRYGNTTSKTLRVAAELVDTGVEPKEIADFLETQTVESLYVLPKILDTLEFFLDGKIASIVIPHNLYQHNMDSEAFIKYPRYIAGVEVALLFKGVTDNCTRVSMRSKDLDVSKVAMEFGGGGHLRAAGCTIHANISETKKVIIEALTRQIKAQAQ